MKRRKYDDLEDLIQVTDFDYLEPSDESERKKKKRNKNKKNHKDSRFYKFTRILAVVYMLLLIVFCAVMVKMDVLPMVTMIELGAVLILLSFVIFIQLFFKNIKLWAKVFATLLSVMLIFVYGVGSAYALGTLSFLDNIGNNVENENRVRVTTEPFNVLITGMDVTGKIDTEGRSDVNMLVTVNPKTGEILLTSIPRDYSIRMVNYGYATDKITHTGFYGVDDTIGAVEDLLDVKVNYYVKVNFTTVIKFIDAIGGIDVYSEYEFVPVKKKDWTVQKGMNHMDGKKALAFARERKAFQLGDNQRIKDQQAVFEALLKKATSSKTILLSYSKILTSVSDYVEMNLSSREIRSLVKLQIARNPKWDIEKITLAGHDSSSGTYSTGATRVYVMAQDADSIEQTKNRINAVISGEDEKNILEEKKQKE